MNSDKLLILETSRNSVINTMSKLGFSNSDEINDLRNIKLGLLRKNSVYRHGVTRFLSTNKWNSNTRLFTVDNNTLMLFPSWLEHNVEPNEKATRNRISISFNTFVRRGVLGKQNDLNQLIL